MVDEHLSPGDVADYWAPDTGADTLGRIESHVFVCDGCARQLAGARAQIDAVRDVVRDGRFQAVVTDEMLNRLARDGVRMRTFTVDPGMVVPCAVWSDDQLIVTRMRADFTGLNSVTIVMQVGGDEVDRVTDVPVRPGARELIEAFSAEHIRTLPQVEVRLQIYGSRTADGDELVAEYVLEHAGTIERNAS